jgi:tetratricopeptide (TPR) repeat protein
MKRILAALLFVSFPHGAFAQEEAKNEAAAAVPVEKRAPSEIRADELDKLFGTLRAGNEEAAQLTEERIWSLWMKTDSPTADVLLSQAAAAMNADEFDASEKILDHLINTSATYAEAYYKRASLFFRMRRYQQALGDLDKVLELEPRHFGAYAARGIIFREQKKRAEALNAFNEALAIHPNFASIVQVVKEMKAEEPDI